eukprot:Hpha_TRINITY_DN22350_c0_g1::TRINITY_DN22350_c0_g1_i1::g.177700::m.177700
MHHVSNGSTLSSTLPGGKLHINILPTGASKTTAPASWGLCTMGLPAELDWSRLTPGTSHETSGEAFTSGGGVRLLVGRHTAEVSWESPAREDLPLEGFGEDT